MAERKEVSVVEQKALVDRVERWLPGVVVVSALTGFSVLAWYAYTTSTQSSNEEDLIVVEADKTPMKEKPLDPGGMKFPNQDKTVFETFSNGTQQQPKVERVLPAPEEPLPKNIDTSGTKTWVNEKLHKNAKDAAQPGGLPGDGGTREQVIGSEDDGEVVVPAQAIATQPSADQLEKKAVDKASDQLSINNPEEIMSFKSAAVTTKAKPDAATPAATVLPPAADSLPAGTVIKGDTWEAASKNIVADDATAAAPEEAKKPESKVHASAEKPVEKPAAKPADKPVAKVEEKPVAKPVEKAEEKPAAKPADVGAAKVQLGAYQSEKEARGELAHIVKKFPAAASHPEIIYKAVVPGRGTFYRLRLGGFSGAADAKSFCAKLSAQGQACILPKD